MTPLASTSGVSVGERLDRFDEAVMLLRRLLDGERIAEHDGRFYTLHDALCEPRAPKLNQEKYA